MTGVQKMWVMRLTGRCLSGAERGRGVLYHAIPGDREQEPIYAAAVCGAAPGRRSNGWTLPVHGGEQEVTCDRCMRRLAKAVFTAA